MQHPCVYNNNAGSCYQIKEKVLSSNTFGRIQIWSKKIKMENLIDDDLEKSSSDQSGSESDNAETESDNEKDNDESNK